MEKVNKKDIIDLLCEEMHVTNREAKEGVDLVLKYIEDSLLEGKEVNLSNFGCFVPIERKSRVGTDPKKHTRITIKKTKTISFRVAKNVKSRMNG